MATLDWDLAIGKIVRSESMAALFGLPPGSLDDPTDDPLDRVHPVDRTRSDDMDLRQKVTAEGIKMEAQWSRMRQLGCHRGQGCWFAQPPAADDLPEILATGNVIARARAAISN
jgi:hypothetical protein